ncbi:MAG TPA: hypothetical protein DCY48_04585 [Candidatus Magasanikbacteria bacterium]|uniref:Uncharacterized protein n=1 Tax=Candidatus Magasanikbacteria bacterium GW2011_GWA2_46_17 TaxID=1619042 RepID=A0A0G1P242_9BACT|nr:MAG: hypothetical protein UX39_C0006G0008 [Candidatus Magasanikbacteria bacterium GW2011_GWA2_46_17]OGH77693.1 MAG: hypothetical protein A3I74_02965 [Candidatus Magasanikbacteria bacterium RIFCSPLOWO2_02_FULL_47_16]OGH79548.1 MAG: hypothetical protein A3C10_00440 [Candidatus Magasanikbacteria bacterium RIFCSPHIGHO2_02_FULL_48_18]OGH83413.1 MAG: hypothetical protein A3G08_01105 [Candidatus Magasanikbacteria bacterium RIFCSPLOWO2_12_FULL_47_9b]HAZ29018.1 hypothetical protein [Candidatus Magasa
MKLFFWVRFLAVCSLVFLPTLALAQGNFGDALKNLNTTKKYVGGNLEEDPGVVVGRTINVALTMVGLIFLVLMVYAGYLWMTARGNEDQVKKAQQIIITTVIGMVIVLSAYAITYLVTTRLAGGLQDLTNGNGGE